jgi:hypothetical protein
MSENAKNVSTDAKAAPSKDWLGGPQNGNEPPARPPKLGVRRRVWDRTEPKPLLPRRAAIGYEVRRTEMKPPAMAVTVATG